VEVNDEMANLDGVHPVLVEKLQRVLAAMEALGFPMFVAQGVRTLEQQRDLYARGRTIDGHIVTNADGIRHKSNHQVADDGYGHAVDCAFRDDPWGEHRPWAAYGACAQAVGLRWGGAWTSFIDRPHVELPSLPPSKGEPA
jgi:peptidoglycan L-alanyl-D-glutamate endopeptidase CwlK